MKYHITDEDIVIIVIMIMVVTIIGFSYLILDLII
jgi:hypothetical protein